VFHLLSHNIICVAMWANLILYPTQATSGGEGGEPKEPEEPKEPTGGKVCIIRSNKTECIEFIRRLYHLNANVCRGWRSTRMSTRRTTRRTRSTRRCDASSIPLHCLLQL
jgi:hypothetical protein